MSEEALIVFSTMPDAETGRTIGRTVVEEKLAACVNLVPQVESIYRWQGAVETSNEVLAIIKTTAGKYQLLENRIRQLHPYEVPEIVAMRLESGSLDYLRWIGQSVE